MSTLKRAIEIATEAHKGQFDKAGKDYIGHPLRVMEMGKTEEEQIVCVLHDSIYAAKQENPNAYEPWTEEADAELTRMWSEGMAVADIADHFRRKNSAIITRLKKLGL